MSLFYDNERDNMLLLNKAESFYRPTISEQELLQLKHFLNHINEQCPSKEDIAFICIGTDQSTGDSFGPLTGTMLKEAGFKYVYGTMDNPCDAYRIEQLMKDIKGLHKVVIAIDACLGLDKSVGKFICLTEPLLPGAATGRRLPAVGDYSIAGVVNANGPKPYWKIQSTSLMHVLNMVYTLQLAIKDVWK